MDTGRARRRLLTGLAGALVIPAWAQGSDEDKAPPPPRVGSVLRLTDVPLLDGRRFSAAEAEGQVTVLYWWASWCPYCAQQSPAMEALWQAQQGRGLRMLALSIDRKEDAARQYLARKGYTFPAAMLTPALARVLPKPRGLPVTVVRGRDGRVLASESGQLFPEDVEQFARFL
jgi:thiol-disulfide isomerase/thioredoxin